MEPEARTVEVRVVVSNPEHRLKPNMYARAWLTASTTSTEKGIVLPSDALQDLDGVTVVFVREAEGRFAARPVAVAERTSASVLLATGLEAGEPVVIDGAFALKSELEKGELGEGHAH